MQSLLRLQNVYFFLIPRYQYFFTRLPISSGGYYSSILRAASLRPMQRINRRLGRTAIRAWMDNDDFLVILSSPVCGTKFHSCLWRGVKAYHSLESWQLSDKAPLSQLPAGWCLPQGISEGCFLFYEWSSICVDGCCPSTQQMEPVPRTMANQISSVRCGGCSAVVYHQGVIIRIPLAASWRGAFWRSQLYSDHVYCVIKNLNYSPVGDMTFLSALKLWVIRFSSKKSSWYTRS